MLFEIYNQIIHIIFFSFKNNIYLENVIFQTADYSVQDTHCVSDDYIECALISTSSYSIMILSLKSEPDFGTSFQRLIRPFTASVWIAIIILNVLTAVALFSTQQIAYVTYKACNLLSIMHRTQCKGSVCNHYVQ